VERSRRGSAVSLTAAGELLLAHAEAILGRVRGAEVDLAARARGDVALLGLGIPDSVGVRVLPELLRHFGPQWPQVRLRPGEASADPELYAGVERGELDLSFVELPAPPGPFETRELLSDPHVLVLASGSPLSGRPLALGDLARTPLVGHTRCRPPRRLATARHRDHSPAAASFVEAAAAACEAIARRTRLSAVSP